MVKIETLLRFVTLEKDNRTASEKGLFTVAYEIYRSEVLTVHEQDELGQIILWFEKHLPTPTKFSRKRNTSHRETKGISWVKSSASEVVSRLYSLKEIVERQGVHCKVLKTKTPGYIVYQDQLQVVAEPFKDTAC